jgi:hypothetical protein
VLKLQKQKNTLQIYLKGRGCMHCVIKGDEHCSNRPFFIICTKESTLLARCHDSECKKKIAESERLKKKLWSYRLAPGDVNYSFIRKSFGVAQIFSTGISGGYQITLPTAKEVKTEKKETDIMISHAEDADNQALLALFA